MEEDKRDSTFSVNDSEPVRLDVEVAKCIHRGDVRERRDDEVLAWRVRL